MIDSQWPGNSNATPTDITFTRSDALAILKEMKPIYITLGKRWEPRWDAAIKELEKENQDAK